MVELMTVGTSMPRMMRVNFESFGGSVIVFSVRQVCCGGVLRKVSALRPMLKEKSACLLSIPVFKGMRTTVTCRTLTGSVCRSIFISESMITFEIRKEQIVASILYLRSK